jgi:hypothetical protein
MTAGSARPHDTGALDVWIRRACALVVAYASYQHQRQFALAGGADQTGARLWPLSVDGLVLLATVGLLRLDHRSARRNRWALWAAFGFGIAVSLAANIAAAPALGWQPVLVAGWPPVALLPAMELLAHRPAPAGSESLPAQSVPAADLIESTETSSAPAAEQPAAASETSRTAETAANHGGPVVALALPTNGAARAGRRNAETIMWAHYERERAAGRTPTGAELDRVAGTNNYGRRVLARWRRDGRLSGAGASAGRGPAWASIGEPGTD